MNDRMLYLRECLNQWDMDISKLQEEQFNQYFDLLLEWNSFMNLTAITKLKDVIEKHYVDSLALGHFHKLSSERILDLGTGAGFPGIPLKILFPETEIVLMDSLNKRIKFLNQVIKDLKLQSICAVHGRAEDMAQDYQYREKFDICTSRAVANLSTLSEYCIPFVKLGGYFIPYKTEHAISEIETSKKAIKVLGGSVDDIKEYMLPNTDMGRTLVFIKKNEKTKKQYPRKAGTPGKEPIN